MTGQAANGNGRPAVHWLRKNHKEWSPPQVLTVTAAMTTTETGDGAECHLAAWAARLDIRHKSAGLVGGTVCAYGQSAHGLAAQVDAWCTGQKTVWLFGHELNVLLSLTRLPVELAALGWHVTAHATASDSPWLRLHKGGCTLTVVDSWGWLRAPLQVVAHDLHGYVWPSDISPGDAEPYAAQVVGDVETLATALLEVMAWWDVEKLGNWTLTGSGCGWNAYRHREDTDLPLIDTHPDETAWDRAAIYGGRREAFQWGQLQGGPWQVLDFRNAYPSIAKAHALPYRRLGEFSTYNMDAPTICGYGHGIIAECVIRTDKPRFPVRSGGRVVYPVGEFTTTLAGPEIQWARELGCLVSIGRGRSHALTWHMRPWAEWALGVLNDGDPRVPDVARRVVKHWTRATIGKWAAKGHEQRRYETFGGGGWYAASGWNAQRNAACSLTEVAGVCTETISAGDGDNAYPAVFAFVESWCRVYLGKAMEAIGLGNVVTCDTDGMIVPASVPWQDAIAAQAGIPLELRPKETVTELRVIGPQHVIGDTVRKLAGVPKKAVETSPGTWEATLNPSLAWQMSRVTGRDPATFVQPKHTVTLPETVITGIRVYGGKVLPLDAALCPEGQNHITVPDAGPRSGQTAIQQSLHLREILTPPYTEGTQCTLHSSSPSGTDSESGPSHPITSSTSAPSPDCRTVTADGTSRRFGRWFARLLRRG